VALVEVLDTVLVLVRQELHPKVSLVETLRLSQEMRAEQVVVAVQEELVETEELEPVATAVLEFFLTLPEPQFNEEVVEQGRETLEMALQRPEQLVEVVALRLRVQTLMLAIRLGLL
jgi:hypothetical protein